MNTPYEKHSYIEEFPNPLIIRKINGNYESIIYLRNKIDKYVIFKIYINNLKNYTVKPSVSFIKPYDSINIHIKGIENFQRNPNKKDKCLIIVFPIEKAIDNNEEVKNIFKDIDIKDPIKQDIYIAIKIDENEVNEVILEENKEELENQIKQVGLNHNTIISNLQKLNIYYNYKINETEKQINEMRKEFENIKRNRELNNLKEKAVNSINQKDKNNQRKISLTILGFLMLITFAFGGFISKLFIKTPFTK